MDVRDITPLIDRLDDNLDALEDAFAPFMSDLSETAGKLPLLDKAKLYVWVTYSIESILFSSLRLHGTDARQHQVFAELARVRKYFEKIVKAEEPKDKPDSRPDDQKVNTQAAIRFIKSDLGDDKTIKTKLNQQLLKEKLKAARQQQQAQQQQQKQTLKRTAAGVSSAPSSAASISSADHDSEQSTGRKKARKDSHPKSKPKAL